MANLAYITPEIITWARELLKMHTADLADVVGVKERQIVAWEQGVAKPTFNQATDLAAALRIPYGYLFLTTPPEIDTPLPDLRTRHGKARQEPSAEFLETLYGVLNRYDWYREYLDEYGATRLSFVSSFTLQDDPLIVAANIRETLAINDELREMSTNLSNYLTQLTANAEYAGILVMRGGVVGNDNNRPLSADEFQGFAITDEIAPVIFINAQDFESAKIFTLAHELAHVWIGKSGISNPDEAEIPDSRDTESFCNAVAVETLVPKEEFLTAWEQAAGSIQTLARRFRVSRLVILRRAHELGLMPHEEFMSLVKLARGARTQTRTGGGGDYWHNVAARHSPKFMDTIVKDVRVGGTLFSDAARLLNIKVPTLTKVVESGEF